MIKIEDKKGIETDQKGKNDEQAPLR